MFWLLFRSVEIKGYSKQPLFAFLQAALLRPEEMTEIIGREVENGITAFEEKQTPRSIDEMLLLVGEYGRFQKIINVMFSIIAFPSAYQLMISYFAFVEPSWKCIKNTTCQLNGTYEFKDKRHCHYNRSDWEYVEPKYYSIVTEFDLQCDREFMVELTTSTLFIGWLCGAIFLGWCIDAYGRSKPLFISVAAVILFGFISAFMPNIYAFICCRFIIGFFLPGTFPQIMFTYISEVVGGKYRAFSGLSIFLFVGTALGVLALKAYYIRNWKVLYIVCTAPYIFVIFFYKYVPESVRFLRVKGKVDEAMAVFKLIAKRNRTEIPPNITIAPPPTNLIHHKANPLDLFRTANMAYKSIIQGIAYFIGAMTFFALYLGAADISGHLYRDYTIVTLIEIPVCLVIMDVTERFGRKRTVMTSLLIGSIMCVGIGFTPKTGKIKIARIILAMIGKVSISAFCNSFQTWSVELYPTNIRGEGMGFVQVMSRLGAASSPWVNKEFNKFHEGASYIFIGIASFVTYFFLCFLPEMKGVPTADAMEEGDKNVETITAVELDIVAYSNPMAEED